MAKQTKAERYEAAKRKVSELKSLYSHIIVYIGVNTLLVVLNLAISPNELWFFWISLFWGVGIGAHIFSVLFVNNIFSKEWEERKIEEFMKKDQ